MVETLMLLFKSKNMVIDENNLNDEAVFEEIIKILHRHRGVDFAYYKQSTIRRRIARRMTFSKIISLK